LENQKKMMMTFGLMMKRMRMILAVRKRKTSSLRSPA